MFPDPPPVPVRAYLQKEFSRIKSATVYDVNAGDWPLVQIAASSKGVQRIVSSGPAVHDAAIGFGLSGRLSGIRLTEGCRRTFPSWGECASPEEIAAAACILIAYCQWVPGAENRFALHAMHDIEKRQSELFLGMLRRIRDIQENLAGRFEFRQECTTTAVFEPLPGDLVLFDPPAFQRNYAGFVETFADYMTGPEVESVAITSEVWGETVAQLVDADVGVIYQSPEKIRVEGCEMSFRYRHSDERHFQYYTNGSFRKEYAEREAVKTSDPGFSVLMGEDLEPGMECAAVRMESQHANHYRSVWTKDANASRYRGFWGFTVGGYLVGLVGMVSGADARNGESEMAIVACDSFPGFTPYERLDRLLWSLCLSEEFLSIFDERTVFRHSGFQKRELSNSPVSMRFRGLMDVVKRDRGPVGWKHILTLEAERPLRFETMGDAFDEWFRKYAGFTRA